MQKYNKNEFRNSKYTKKTSLKTLFLRIVGEMGENPDNIRD